MSLKPSSLRSRGETLSETSDPQFGLTNQAFHHGGYVFDRAQASGMTCSQQDDKSVVRAQKELPSVSSLRMT